MRLVLVEWLDSFGCSSSWETMRTDGEAPEMPVCRSVGWLHYDGDALKVIVPHVAEATRQSERQGMGEMAIPAAAILRVVDLEVPPAAPAAPARP